MQKGKRQEARDKGKRQEAKSKSQKARDKCKKARGKRQEDEELERAISARPRVCGPKMATRRASGQPLASLSMPHVMA